MATESKFVVPYWANSLKNGHNALLNRETPQPGNLIVRRRRPNERTGELIQLFALFSSPEHLLSYINSKSPGERDIYELVLENQLQKPRFDIDLDLAKLNLDEKAADTLFNAIIADLRAVTEQLVKERFGVAEATPPTGGILYPSHGSSKRSGHYVLTRLHHTDCKAARRFYDAVVLRMRSEHRNYLDHAVYSTAQNFRCLYCAKWSSGRPKSKEGATSGVSLADFEESLLTHTAGTVLLPDNQPAVAPSATAKIVPPQAALPELTELALEQMAKVISVDDFEQDGCKDGYIRLKRLRPSLCVLCARVHDNDNAFLRLSKVATRAGQWHVKFHCFRQPQGEGRYLGIITEGTQFITNVVTLPGIPGDPMWSMPVQRLEVKTITTFSFQCLSLEQLKAQTEKPPPTDLTVSWLV